MKTIFTIFTLFLLTTGTLSAQTLTNDYFEVYTKPAHTRAGMGLKLNSDSIMARIRNISDTATQFATFAATVNDIANVDSVTFTLINSQGQTVSTVGGSLVALRTNPKFRIDENTLFYTVGPYAYLKRFTATVSFSNSPSTPIVNAFSKN